MKKPADKFTGDMFSKPSQGQRRLPNAKSAAQRMREYQQRRKFNFLFSVARQEK